MKTVTLQFHPASDPPDDDRTVLCCDGHTVMGGWYDEYASGGPCWYSVSGDEWPGVLSWAELPKAEECV